MGGGRGKWSQKPAAPHTCNTEKTHTQTNRDGKKKRGPEKRLFAGLGGGLERPGLGGGGGELGDDPREGAVLTL